MAKATKNSNRNNIFKRLFRSLISVVILTAFVLGISVTVRSLYSMDPVKLAKLARPLLSKLNIDEEQAGRVAGIFAQRINETSVHLTASDSASTLESENIDQAEYSDSSSAQTEGKEIAFKLALIADSEDDFESLREALLKAKEFGAETVFFLGDLTNYGDLPALREGKKVLDDAELEYYILPGDHDLADSVEDKKPAEEYFAEVFDLRNQIVNIGTFKFVLFDNSKNFTSLTQSDLDWFTREVKSADFVLLAQPLYHPVSRVIMGYSDGEEVPEVRSQANELLNLIRGFDVRAVIAADQHLFSQNEDETKPELLHFVTGAVNKSRNLDGPNFEILSIYTDSTFSVEKIKI